MRYCSVLALKAAREREKKQPFCCDSEFAHRQQGSDDSNLWPNIFLSIVVVSLTAALIADLWK